MPDRSSIGGADAVFFICIWVLAIGEDGFEKPFNIIPFYVFFGVVLRMACMLRCGMIGPVMPEAIQMDHRVGTADRRPIGHRQRPWGPNRNCSPVR